MSPSGLGVERKAGAGQQFRATFGILPQVRDEQTAPWGHDHFPLSHRDDRLDLPRVQQRKGNHQRDQGFTVVLGHGPVRVGCAVTLRLHRFRPAFAQDLRPGPG